MDLKTQTLMLMINTLSHTLLMPVSSFYAKRNITILSGISELKTDEVMGIEENCVRKELHNLYSSPKFVRMIK